MTDQATPQETARLTVDLSALCANYANLKREAPGTRMSAVVKANGYGLGAVEVVKGLAAAGCDLFFATRADEGAELRDAGVVGDIYILDGLVEGNAAAFHRHRLTPVLNSANEIGTWRGEAKARGEVLDAAIHFDTGMNRLGMPPEEFEQLAGNNAMLEGLNIAFWMSHLASADERSSHVNTKQLERFRAGLARLPMAKACLANSAGIYLGRDYHFDVCRPGLALYGVSPGAGMGEDLATVATAEARILQVRHLPPGESAGYGAIWTASRPTTLATLAIGYADGYPWSLGNKGFVAIGGVRCPVVGRVSMDLITVDMTNADQSLVHPGGWAEILGAEVPATELAGRAETLPYELLTSLGKRYTRRYV